MYVCGFLLQIPIGSSNEFEGNIGLAFSIHIYTVYGYRLGSIATWKCHANQKNAVFGAKNFIQIKNVFNFVWYCQ